MWILILGLIVFLGIHSVQMLAPRWREDMIVKLGNNGWRGLYSVFSLGGLGLIIWGFSEARPDVPDFYYAPTWMPHLVMVLMLISFVFLIAGNLPTGYIKARLKHPMITGVIIWAIAHLMTNGDLASILLFGSILIWAVLNRISVERRSSVAPVVTSIYPDIIALVVGVGLWMLMLHVLHGMLIGVEVIA
ncbi:MAG: NnrU family protein [Rhizobiaceae bacterium]|nr:NnrU family protein [Rhizobiaceae bacterium]